jgi:hypothetical protein
LDYDKIEVGKPTNFNQIISVLFHPIIYPMIATLIFLFYTPHFFPARTKWVFVWIVLVATMIFPLIFLYFLKKSEIITSYYLKGITERKYPFVIFTLIALILNRMFFKMGIAYDLGVFFIAASMSFLVGYWFLWFKIKVSIHTLGLGSLIGFLAQLSIFYQINFLIQIASLFILFGIVAKARIELQAHDFKEVLLGFVIGILPQLLIPFMYQNT